MIHNDIFFKEKIVHDRMVYWPVLEKAKAKEQWGTLSTYIAILEVNDWIKTSADFRHHISQLLV